MSLRDIDAELAALLGRTEEIETLPLFDLPATPDEPEEDR